MEPYYQDEWVTLYHGDCLELADVWTGADSLVTDPPYGTQFSKANAKGGYGRRQNAGLGPEGFVIANDDTTATRDAVLELWGDRPALVFASPRLAEPPGRWEDRLVWNKTRPGMNGGPFRYTHEAIYARGMVRVDNSTFSILTGYPDQSDHIHSKPIGVMEALVATSVGVVAEPFAGSGSTLIAARNLGRHAIGVEVEEKYCEVIARRLERTPLPMLAAAAPVSSTGAFDLEGL